MNLRKGKYKVIQGYIRDPHWYSEPTEDKMNTSDTGILVRIMENLARLSDWLFGHVANDLTRIWFTNFILLNSYAKNGGFQTLLFDIENDPRETTNIADKHPDIVKDLLADIDIYKKDCPKTAPYWMITKNWVDTFITGNSNV